MANNFQAKPEWVAAAKKQPVSYKQAELIATKVANAAKTEESSKADFFKYRSQLVVSILSCAYGEKCKLTGKKGTFSKFNAHELIGKLMQDENTKLPAVIQKKYDNYQNSAE